MLMEIRCARRAALRATRVAGALMAVLVLGGGAAAQESDRGSPSPVVEAVTATLDVERTILKEDLEQRDRLAAERARVTARLGELYAELDAALKRTDPALAKALDEARASVQATERQRADLLAEEQAVLDKIQDRLRRIKLLEDRLAALQDRVHEVAGPLEGKWDVALLPSGQRGTFSLAQSGTLVSGTYQLEGGWSGSLQGTLVNRKVRLERIDSKLGRSAEFEGYLSSDGSRIRGTWRSYEMSAAEASTGQWSAVRRAPSP